jgi:signal peptidase II
MPKMFLGKLPYLGLTFLVLAIDQASKAWASSVVQHIGEQTVISGILNFAYVRNTGVAFSMFSDAGNSSRWPLATAALIAATLVFYFFLRTPVSHKLLLGLQAFLLAGVAGNVTDRIRLGFVVDLVDVHLGFLHWPTFNVADVAIWIGVGLFLFGQFRSKKMAINTDLSLGLIEGRELQTSDMAGDCHFSTPNTLGMP